MPRKWESDEADVHNNLSLLEKTSGLSYLQEPWIQCLSNPVAVMLRWCRIAKTFYLFSLSSLEGRLGIKMHTWRNSALDQVLGSWLTKIDQCFWSGPLYWCLDRILLWLVCPSATASTRALLHRMFLGSWTPGSLLFRWCPVGYLSNLTFQKWKKIVLQGGFFLSLFCSEKYQNSHRSGQDLCHNVFGHNLSAETPRNQNGRGVQGGLSPPTPLVDGGESETLSDERWAQVTWS